MDRMIKDQTGKFIKHANPNCCTVGGDSPIQGHGFCNRHYLRFIRYGDPNIRKKRANGEGGITTQGYRMITVNGEKVYEHRHVMSFKLGRPLLRSEIVHHADGDKLNNSPENLVLVNRSDHVHHHPECLVNLELGPFRRGTI